MNKRDKDKKDANYKFYIVIAIVAIVAFCVFSVTFGVVPFDLLPINYIGAVLSSLIGALIILILLRGQTNVEEERGKNIRILKRKINKFQEFINDVWEIWERQKITIEEFQKLTSNYYKNLMLYLDNDKLEDVGKKLSLMGETIGKDGKDDVDKLRKSIVHIINVLSKDIELGGQVDESIMDEHDKIIFPLWFKNSILESLNSALLTDGILKEGVYDNYFNSYGIGFEFTQFKGCKMVLLGLNGQMLHFYLHIDLDRSEFDSFRDERKYLGYKVMIPGFLAGDLRNPITNEMESDNEKAPFLDFSINENGEKSMNFYRINKRNFAKTLAFRAKFYFDMMIDGMIDESGKKINERSKKDGTTIEGLGILEFLSKYWNKSELKHS